MRDPKLEISKSTDMEEEIPLDYEPRGITQTKSTLIGAFCERKTGLKPATPSLEG